METYIAAWKARGREDSVLSRRGDARLRTGNQDQRHHGRSRHRPRKLQHEHGGVPFHLRLETELSSISSTRVIPQRPDWPNARQSREIDPGIPKGLLCQETFDHFFRGRAFERTQRHII
jgi:hypothetical protein